MGNAGASSILLSIRWLEPPNATQNAVRCDFPRLTGKRLALKTPLGVHAARCHPLGCIGWTG